MKEPSERAGTREPTQRTSVTEASGTARWTVVVLLIVAALIILVPMRNAPETALTPRIVLSTIVLAVCGLIAIWNNPTD